MVPDSHHPSKLVSPMQVRETLTIILMHMIQVLIDSLPVTSTPQAQLTSNDNDQLDLLFSSNPNESQIAQPCVMITNKHVDTVSSLPMVDICSLLPSTMTISSDCTISRLYFVE